MNIKIIVINRHIIEISIDEALKEINFDPKKFNNRYENYATEEAKYCMEELSL